MRGISPKKFRNSADKNVDESYRDSFWEVFDFYDLKDSPEGRYLYAPQATPENVLNEEWTLRPLSRGNAGLFLEFSNWPVTRDMDKAIETLPGAPPTLDTERNAAAAKEWAENYGVLGLGTNPSEEHAVGGSSSLSLTTARYTGASHLGHELRRAYRNSPRGGTHETVEAFAFEAWQAYLARRLYEIASRKVLDVAFIVRLMDEPLMGDGTPTGSWQPPRPWYWASERQQWSEDTWSIRRWALGIVEEAVMLKVENDCYPTLNLIGDPRTAPEGDGWPVAYKQGWGTKSLLGAMWLQMMWLLAAENNTCEWCGALLEKERKDQRFCRNGGRCKASWNYHHGGGKSSKTARKRARDKDAS